MYVNHWEKLALNACALLCGEAKSYVEPLKIVSFKGIWSFVFFFPLQLSNFGIF